VTPSTTLVAATAVHAGFQLTVTTLVYPALARVPPGQWVEAHRAHSRAITPLVAVVYGGLAAAGGGVALSGPYGWEWVALSAIAISVLITAAVAAPAHGRLGGGHDSAGLRRLLRADRIRTAAALVALGAALVSG
jgi:hypothetical protein